MSKEERNRDFEELTELLKGTKGTIKDIKETFAEIADTKETANIKNEPVILEASNQLKKARQRKKKRIDKMGKDVQVNGVYRHYKGKYYLVIAVACKEDSFDNEVIYQELYGDSEVWSRGVVSFTSELEESVVNPTGQKYRFELIEDFNNQLSAVSTENLVKELQGREDNPFAEIDLKEFEESIFLRDFVVGTVLTRGEDEELNIANTFENEEFARHYMSSRMGKQLFKRLLIKIE